MNIEQPERRCWGRIHRHLAAIKCSGPSYHTPLFSPPGCLISGQSAGGVGKVSSQCFHPFGRHWKALASALASTLTPSCLVRVGNASVTVAVAGADESNPASQQARKFHFSHTERALASHLRVLLQSKKAQSRQRTAKRHHKTRQESFMSAAPARGVLSTVI